MSDQDYLEAIRRARKEAVSFFSNKSKPERERWVVTEFLSNLGISITDAEVCSSPVEPPDVTYNDARFEIKEILDPGRRRHTEYKDALRRAEVATSAEDLLEEYAPRDIRYSEVCKLVVDRLCSEQKYAPAVRHGLDLLFYVNLNDVHGYVSDELPPVDDIASFGWRSVSFVAGPLSVVLQACDIAPAFLRGAQGQAIRRVRAP